MVMSNRINVTIALDYYQLCIVYLAVGCADPEVSPGLVLTRQNPKGVKVQCNNSNQAWHLVCKDTEWVGQIGQCQGGKFLEAICTCCDQFSTSTHRQYGISSKKVLQGVTRWHGGYTLLSDL